jgi:hypothetical protein
MLDYQIKFTYVNEQHIQYKLIYQPVREPSIYLNKNEICVITSKKLSDYTINTFVPNNIAKYLFIVQKKETHASINTDLTKFRIFEKYYEIKQANLKGHKLYEIIGNTIYLNQKYQKQVIVRNVYNDIICPYVIKRLKY